MVSLPDNQIASNKEASHWINGNCGKPLLKLGSH